MYLRHRTRPDGRRAHAVVELLLILPILLGLLLGTIEFSLLLQVRQELLAAACEGARVAARGGTDAEAQGAVQTALGSADLAAAAMVTVTRTPAAPPNTRDQVTVDVSVSATVGVPNLLPFIVNLNGTDLSARATMNVE